jgi:hypothetical protein
MTTKPLLGGSILVMAVALALSIIVGTLAQRSTRAHPYEISTSAND